MGMVARAWVLQLLPGLLLLLPSARALGSTCSFEQHNHSGCTAGGHYAASTVASPAECCAQCEAESQCMSWSFHAQGTACYLATEPKLATNPGTADTTCGCRHPGCSPQPQPAATCEPVLRPPKPTRIPLPAGKTQPHIVTILVGTIIRSLVVGSRRSLNEAGAVRVR